MSGFTFKRYLGGNPLDAKYLNGGDTKGESCSAKEDGRTDYSFRAGRLKKKNIMFNVACIYEVNKKE